MLGLAGAALLLSQNETVQQVAKNVVSSLPRGLRNNNPLNLRRGVKWAGLDPNGASKDKAFDVFLSMEYGLRAALRNMETAVRKHKCTTVAKLVNRWAPPSENDTGKYVQTVAAAVPISPTQTIPMDDRFTVARILYAMAQVENGPDVTKKVLPFQVVHDVVKKYAA